MTCHSVKFYAIIVQDIVVDEINKTFKTVQVASNRSQELQINNFQIFFICALRPCFLPNFYKNGKYPIVFTMKCLIKVVFFT